MLTTPEAESTPACDESSKAKEELPPLSDRDFKIYNRLAEKMNYFVRAREPSLSSSTVQSIDE